MDNLWKNALNYIKPEMTEVSYNTWVDDKIIPVSLNEDMLILEVQSEMQSNMLMSRYYDLIQDAVQKASGKELDIVIQHGHKPATLMSATTRNHMLNPKYTFDTFVIGKSNQFAHAAALAVAESPANAYNPLFLHGGVGLGKTHLMHAIGHYIFENNSSAKILYITSEKFTNELITAIQTNRNTEFRNRYRNADVLLVDDIQFIEGKESTQEEFFHTFNTLHNADKQIIISSDRPPAEMRTLEERLLSRFEWGLIADIQKPDFETRVAILRKKAQSDHIAISDDALQYIAEGIDSNIRVLEGSLATVKAYSKLTNRDINLELVREVLKDQVNRYTKRDITASNIISVLSDYYNVSVEDIIGKKRTQDIAMIRQTAMYISRELTEYSLPKIGSEFGGRDHATVIHACNKISAKIKEDPSFENLVNDLITRIKS